MTFQLRDDLTYCLCAGRAIFLDLRSGRYFCLTPALEACFKAWASSTAGDVGERCIRRLRARGLVVPARKGGPAVSPAIVPPIAGDLDATGSPRPRYVVEAFAAQLRAATLLRWRPLAKVLANCRARPAPVGTIYEPRPGAPEAIAAAFAATAIVIGSFDRCLARAIAAKMVCRRRGVEATLVFGVRVNPFGAHSWVQAADRLVVGAYEQARLFTPILAIQ